METKVHVHALLFDLFFGYLTYFKSFTQVLSGVSLSFFPLLLFISFPSCLYGQAFFLLAWLLFVFSHFGDWQCS